MKKFAQEWLDTLVVAISVAMAFRAYFYEPFKIPTGSMQPTLWGYHTIEGVEKGNWDVAPLSWLKWLWSGSKVVEYKSPVDGVVRCAPTGDGFVNVAIGTSNEVWSLPSDAAAKLNRTWVKAGETFWKGEVASGDFIFVNRWKWNLWQPQRGDVMIFSTTGIKGLPQGTHYIKRMKARPGETYKLEHPVDALEVTMGDNEYYACGDNFNNSFDSRYWGTVPRDNLRGEGAFVFWPFNRWRIIK